MSIRSESRSEDNRVANKREGGPGRISRSGYCLFRGESKWSCRVWTWRHNSKESQCVRLTEISAETKNQWPGISKVETFSEEENGMPSCSIHSRRD